MFESFISSILGPSGNVILNWYVTNSLFINGFVVVLGIIVVLAPRHSQKVKETIQKFWNKSPLALDEKDRRAIEAARSKVAATKSRRAK